MEKLFGVATDSLALYLALTFVLLVGILMIQGLRNPILVKLGVRNIPKRPGQSVLIVVGLMLSTVIIGASLGIGDTVYNSIRTTALEGSGYVDETIEFSDVGPERYFPEDTVDDFVSMFEADTRVDGIISRIGVSLPAMNLDTNRTESSMTVRGYESNSQDGFGDILDLAGDNSIRIADLREDEIILNRNAADILGANIGDNVSIYAPKAVTSFNVRFIAKHGGLASGGDTKLILMSLRQLQDLTAKHGLIDWIGISNQGGIEDGLRLSEEIAQELRIALVDKAVARQIAEIIKDSPVLNKIVEHLDNLEVSKSARDNSLGDETIQGLRDIMKEIEDGRHDSEKYLGLIAKEDNIGAIFSILSEYQDVQIYAEELGVLSLRLSQLNVRESKANGLRIAEAVGTSVTYLFTIFGSFSIIVGLLLIFLVMVLLASSRSMEMGMARAIGLKRRHLVQMFTFEGSAYAFGAAVIGTALGALVSIILVGLLRQAVGGDDWPIRISFTIKSLWITFSAGFLLTLITVGISSYRVSRLNIVVAIRGLNEEFVTPRPKGSWKEGLKGVGIGLIGPIYILRVFRYGVSVGKLVLLFKVTLLWPISILRQILRIFPLILSQGWALVPLGIVLHRAGMTVDNGTLFSIGVSMSIIGFGLILRKILGRLRLSGNSVRRLAATFEGIFLMLFWGLPFDTFEPYSGKLDTTPDIFVLGGVAQIGSAVWLVMNNSEILLWISNRTLGRVSGLQAAFKTAIAYPVYAPFRTGLTVSMFGLVIFTLMIFAVLNNLNNVSREQPDRVTGGFDIVASVRTDFSMSIEELEHGIEEFPNLDIDKFDVIAGSLNIPAMAREMDGGYKQFSDLQVRSVDKVYLENTRLEFAKVHPVYKGEDSLVWRALMSNDNFVVISNSALPSDDPFGPQARGLQLNSISPGSVEGYWPDQGIRIEVLSRQGIGDPISLEVIGVIDSLADQQDFTRSVYIIGGKSLMDTLAPHADTGSYNVYSIMVEENVGAEELIPFLETAFITRGMKAVSTLGQIEKSLETGDAFNKLFQGFMGLGLVVGVIAIAVLSIRAVVERRQAIGTMRAIGYKARMVWLSFLLESLYITMLGIVLGLGLGALTSWNIFNEISKEVEGISYKIPWVNVMVIVGITLFFALLSSFIPAKQASKIYPAEALRYE